MHVLSHGTVATAPLARPTSVCLIFPKNLSTNLPRLASIATGPLRPQRCQHWSRSSRESQREFGQAQKSPKAFADEAQRSPLSPEHSHHTQPFTRHVLHPQRSPLHRINSLPSSCDNGQHIGTRHRHMHLFDFRSVAVLSRIAWR